MQLHNLPAPRGGNKKRKRIGRGESSGWGKTAGRGMGGQKSRTGKGKPKIGFEGGQAPMYIRMPKRGFTNIFAKRWAEINLDILAKHFASGATVDLDGARKAGLAGGRDEGIRILGRGELPHPLTVVAHHVTASAKKKIEEAGGKVLTVGNDAKESSAAGEEAAPAPNTEA